MKSIKSYFHLDIRACGYKYRIKPISDAMTKPIAADRGIDAFELIFRNPPKQLQTINSASGACALRPDTSVIREKEGLVDRSSDYHSKNAFTTLDENLSESFSVDKQLRRQTQESESGRNFKRYGDYIGNSKLRRENKQRNMTSILRDTRIVCHKNGYHSSKNRKQGSRMYRNL